MIWKVPESPPSPSHGQGCFPQLRLLGAAFNLALSTSRVCMGRCMGSCARPSPPEHQLAWNTDGQSYFWSCPAQWSQQGLPEFSFLTYILNFHISAFPTSSYIVWVSTVGLCIKAGQSPFWGSELHCYLFSQKSPYIHVPHYPACAAVSIVKLSTYAILKPSALGK